MATAILVPVETPLLHHGRVVEDFVGEALVVDPEDEVFDVDWVRIECDGLAFGFGEVALKGGFEEGRVVGEKVFMDGVARAE